MLTLAACPAGSDRVAMAADPQAVRSQTVEIQYRLDGARSDTEIELWYTRDRGTTWQKYGVDPDVRSPFVFVAPAEGLYGITLIVREGQQASAPAPKPHDQPQRWVFVDYTPPLAQWLGAEPGDEFKTRRIVQLRWTAHDDNLVNRPISLSWQSSVDQKWQVIANELPNAGRYDWVVPAGVSGQVTLKLAVRDRGGHVVERLLGPVPIATWKASVSTGPAAENTNPGRATATAPATATQPAKAIAFETRQKAEEHYKQGSWHLARGQYALAAERFRESLDLDPGMLSAKNDLAGAYYLLKDYEKATDLYLEVLKTDGKQADAMRGAALAYVARKRYADSRDMLTRLLGTNDKDAEATLDLGDVLFMMGDREGARKQWDRAMSIDGAKAGVAAKARKRLDLYGPTAAGDASTIANGTR